MDLCKPDGGDDAKLISNGHNIHPGGFKAPFFIFDNFLHPGFILFRMQSFAPWLHTILLMKNIPATMWTFDFLPLMDGRILKMLGKT